MGRGRAGADGIGGLAHGQGAQAVHRLGKGIDHAAQPIVVGIYHRFGILDLGAAAQADAVDGDKRHEQGAASAKAHHLAGDAAAITGQHMAAVPHGKLALNATGFDQHALHPGHPAIDLDSGQPVDVVEQVSKHEFQRGMSYLSRNSYCNWPF